MKFLYLLLVIALAATQAFAVMDEEVIVGDDGSVEVGDDSEDADSEDADGEDADGEDADGEDADGEEAEEEGVVSCNPPSEDDDAEDSAISCDDIPIVGPSND